MRCAGLSFEGKKVKIALVSKVKNQLTVERLEEFSEIPHDLLQEKNLHIVTGLGTDAVIRREVLLKLKRQSALLKALPFQLENVLPFPPEETLVHPFFFPQRNGTDVVVFGTTRRALEEHIAILQEKGIDPDQVSCVPIALARWVHAIFPQNSFVNMIHEHTGLALEGEKIVFAQLFEDKERLNAYLRNKFGHHLMISSEGPTFQGYSYDRLLPFAVPLGLALDGLHPHPCQFRQGKFLSSRAIKKKKLWTKGLLTASLGLAVLVGVVGGWTLRGKQKALEKKIETYVSTPALSLDEKISLWQKKLIEDAQGFPLLPDVPSVRDVLAWLSGLQEPIEIVQFHYSLVQYPKAGEKLQPYLGKVDVEFKAASPAIAHRFQEALEKTPTLIDKKQKIIWTAQQDSYKLSFCLRKV